MKRTHKRLAAKHAWYANWHALPYITLVHFFILAGLGSYMATFIQANIMAQSAAVVFGVQQTPQSVGYYTSRILQLSRQYRTAASDAERTSLKAELESALAERTKLITAQMQGNPKGFLQNAIPNDVRANLPDFVQQMMEQSVDLEGTLSIIHIDALPPDMGPSHEETVYDLDSNEGAKHYRLHFAGEIPDGLKTSDTVRVQGYALGADIVPVEGASGTGVTTTESNTVAAASTNERTLVMLVNFTDATSQPFSIAQITGVVFGNANSTNSFYQENSFGSIALSGDVVGWYTIPYSASDCSANYSRNGTAAEQAAIAAGVPVGDYPHRIYVFNCQLGGLGTIGGNPTRSWIGYGSQSYALDPSVYTHEFGHNLGTRHAQWLKCGTKQVDVYTNCTTDEYGDRTDVMGYMWGYYHQFNATRKMAKSWLPSSIHLQTVNGSGTYTITASEGNDATIKTLKIAKPNTSEAYYVSYRQPIGFDLKLPAAFVNGASIHIWNGSLGSQTKLIDVIPGDSNVLNAALFDGGTFTDSLNGITITQTGHTANTVTLNVQFGSPTCVRSAPTIGIAPLSQSGTAGANLSYTMTVKNNDSAACATAAFAVSATVAAGWSTTLSASSVSLAPGATGSAMLSVTSAAGAVDGSYSVGVSANDAAVSGHSGSANASYVVFTPLPDTSAPTTSITNPLNNTTVGSTVAITASAADDIGITKLELWADDVLVSTDTAAPYAWGWDTTLETAGLHTLMTKAYDAAGNTGSSASVTVQVDNQSDIVPPTVVFTSPKNGTKIRGNAAITVSASASDNRGVVAITLSIDGARVLTCIDVSSCVYSWPGKQIKAGLHTLSAAAYDAVGNIGTSIITVTK